MASSCMGLRASSKSIKHHLSALQNARVRLSFPLATAEHRKVLSMLRTHFSCLCEYNDCLRSQGRCKLRTSTTYQKYKLVQHTNLGYTD